jgi:tungstate transport system substrate-binding protein
MMRKDLLMKEASSYKKGATKLTAAFTASYMSRWRFLRLLGSATGAATAGALAACNNLGAGSESGDEAKGSSATRVATQPSQVRLFSVVTPQDGGLYDDLLPDFEQQTGYRVELTTDVDVYGPARDGQADVVISHYGHEGVQAFVQDGFGRWPQTVFFNQHVLLGPPSDPARIQDLTDLVEAFSRVAQSRSPFIVNNSEGIKYLSEFLWKAAGSPEKEGWYSEQGAQGQEAIANAAQQRGYVLWGLTPFLRAQQQNRVELQPLVLNDPLLQRIMVTVAVNPDKVPEVNVRGAEAFQQYLLDPTTQARIRAFRLPGIDQQVWWPAGRNNAGYALPKL